MSLLARLAPHLPYVRRYARALTGDQATGDNYVRVALEALAAGERQLSPDMTPRVALYHVFHTIWSTTGAQLEDASGIEGQDDASRRLMRIAPRSRQAFLLTALEGFTPSEAAQILSADAHAVERLIGDAQAEIDAELATDVLIIEDEAIISADIESLVKELVTTSPPRRRPTTKPSTPSPAIARAWCWPTSSWRTALPASTRSRTSSSGSTCR